MTSERVLLRRAWMVSVAGFFSYAEPLSHSLATPLAKVSVDADHRDRAMQEGFDSQHDSAIACFLGDDAILWYGIIYGADPAETLGRNDPLVHAQLDGYAREKVTICMVARPLRRFCEFDQRLHAFKMEYELGDVKVENGWPTRNSLLSPLTPVV